MTKNWNSIRDVFLTPNVMSKWKSMDQGIINNLKLHYWRRIMRKIIAVLEGDNQSQQITLLDAITNLSKA